MENEIDKVESLRKLSENCFDWQYYRLNNRDGIKGFKYAWRVA